MSQEKTEQAATPECGLEYEQHPTMPHLVAVCARPDGHDGDHSNVLPKTLASLLGGASDG